MRDLHRDRVAPSAGPNPMFLRSLERARVLDAQRAERQAEQERPEDRP